MTSAHHLYIILEASLQTQRLEQRDGCGLTMLNIRLLSTSSSLRSGTYLASVSWRANTPDCIQHEQARTVAQVIANSSPPYCPSLGSSHLSQIKTWSVPFTSYPHYIHISTTISSLWLSPLPCPESNPIRPSSKRLYIGACGDLSAHQVLQSVSESSMYLEVRELQFPVLQVDLCRWW